MAAAAASFAISARSLARMNVLARLDVNALIRSGVFFLPAALVDEESPELFMRLHPEHRIDAVFLDHPVPRRLVDLPMDQREIVAQHGIRIGGGGAAVDEQGHGAARVIDQEAAGVPVVEQSRLREMGLQI